jgi:SRSO17 transposase
MLPDIRTQGDPFSIPTFDLIPSDVEGFMDDLCMFQSTFHDCFERSESREHFFHYMVGQFSDLKRKSIEPMALEVEGGNIRGMQRFISDVRWDEEHLLWAYHHHVAEDLGDPSGVVMLDESGMVKKGNESAGVARQYCGSIGKVENSQVGVFAAYASRHGYGFLDKRLFMPEVWFSEAYAERRRKCEVPKERVFESKPQLAAAMLQALYEQALVPFKYVVADCLYGNSPDFLGALDAGVGVTALVAISSETRCWLQAPETEEKTYTYKGEGRTKRVVVEPALSPVTVAVLAKSLPASSWYRRKVSEGTKGPIEYEFARRRVTLSKDGLPDRTVWLVMKRTLGSEPSYSYYLSNAPASTPLRLLVWLSGIRWAVEQCFEEGKSELGMAHYEVRKYRGWHHHMLMTMLAHFFLWRLKVRWGKKSAGAHGVTVAHATRSDLASAYVYDCTGSRLSGVDTGVQSPGLLFTPPTSASQRLSDAASALAT